MITGQHMLSAYANTLARWTACAHNMEWQANKQQAKDGSTTNAAN
jgi:hypothetical protein